MNRARHNKSGQKRDERGKKRVRWDDIWTYANTGLAITYAHMNYESPQASSEGNVCSHIYRTIKKQPQWHLMADVRLKIQP